MLICETNNIFFFCLLWSSPAESASVVIANDVISPFAVVVVVVVCHQRKHSIRSRRTIGKLFPFFIIYCHK